MPPISVAIAENCSVSLVFLVSMRFCPAERSAATRSDTSESMLSPEPMPVEVIAIMQSFSGCHVEKCAGPLIQKAPHLQRFFTWNLANDFAGGGFAHGDHHAVGIGVDAEFQVSAIRTQVIAHLLRHGGHALPHLALGCRRGGGTDSGRHGVARVRDRLG